MDLQRIEKWLEMYLDEKIKKLIQKEKKRMRN